MTKARASFVGLRGLILTFVLLAVLATLCNSLVVAYKVQRDALIHQALASNRAYAYKVASTISEFLGSIHRRLEYSSRLIGKDFGNAALLQEEVQRLQAQDLELNLVLVADASGKVLNVYPESPELLEGVAVKADLEEALATRKFSISRAFTASSGNLIVFVSHPIFGPKHEFLGIVGGSVYLQQHGVMHALIGHHQMDGAFAFLTDEARRLLYHPDHARIGDTLTISAPVDAALRGEEGSIDAVNFEGVDMLSGYAQVPRANWAVVAQQSRADALAPLTELMRQMVVGIIPAGLLGLVLILAGALFITRPLRQLSSYAKSLAKPDTAKKISAVSAWYAEAASIRGALLIGGQLLHEQIGQLSRAAESDELTGLANRRAMNSALQLLDEAPDPYAVLALDIDHFKRVNDTYGHDVGDVALKHIARIIAEHSRAGDLPCRPGGEEFCLVLPNTGLKTAGVIGERIRATIAASPVPGVGTLTISIGVAMRTDDDPRADSVLKKADERLYKAKDAGRNRVVLD